MRDTSNVSLTAFAKDVSKKVAKQKLLPYRDLLYGGSRRPLVEARWHVFCLLRAKGYSYKKIANMFSMDHTTVLYGVRKLTERNPELDWNEELNSLLET